MTTGSFTMDGRYNVSDPAIGTSRIGRYLDRTWIGGNQTTSNPPITKTIQLRRHKPATVYFNKRTGAYFTKRGIEVVEVVKTYHAKTRKGLFRCGDPHPYSLKRNEWNNPLIFIKQHGIPNSPVYQGGFREIWSEPTGATWTSNDDIALLGKLREEIVGSSFNPAVFLAEEKPALEMIRDAATRIGSSIRYARKGNWSKAFAAVSGARPPKSSSPWRKHTGTVASNNWLELQYGWLPLMSDAADGAAFLATTLNRPLTFRVRATFRRKQPLGNTTFPGGGIHYGSQKCYARGQYIAYLTEVSFPQMGGIYDPASIIWEMLPYSFVADWFIPIGEYLQARQMIGALTGTFVKSTKTLLEASDPCPYGTGYWDYAGGDLQSFRISRVNFARSVSTSLSIPKPSLKSFGSVASWRHCANAVALLTQVAKIGHLR